MNRRLFLLHGAGGNAASWGPVVPPLVDAVRSRAEVICVDLPGRGVTPGPPAATAFEAAEWLAMTRTDDRAPPAVLVGHSYGGAVALAMALAHPRRVGALVLVATGARLRVAPSTLEAVDRATAEAPFGLDFAFAPATPAAVRARYAADTRDVAPATTRADWRACDDFDVRTWLPAVTAPTLIVHGDLDPLTPPRHQITLAEALPDANRVELLGRGHMLPWEDPDGFAASLGGWIAGQLR